jgi:hypothetical protein
MLKPLETDKSGLVKPTTLEELLRDFEPCGGYLRRKDCTVQKPSCLLTVMDVVELWKSAVQGK